MHPYNLAVKENSAKRHFMLTLVKFHEHAFQHIRCYQLNKQRHALLLICTHNLYYLERGKKAPNHTFCKTAYSTVCCLFLKSGFKIINI